MTQQTSYIVNTNGITVFHNSQLYTAATDHPNYNKIVKAIKEKQFDSIPTLVNIALDVQQRIKSSGDDIVIDATNGVITYKGDPVHGLIVDRILQFVEQDIDVQPLIEFMKNLYQNPSATAVKELYGFLEYGNNPITPDGHFLAYKRVRDDYKSVHDGKTDNSIGSKPSLPRNAVDDNRDHTCSFGLHFCSHEYLARFSGERVVVLKINPKDVVSIPSDYHNTKGRACTYEIVGELTDLYRDTSSTFWTSPLINDVHNPKFVPSDDYEDDDYDDEYEDDDYEYEDDNLDYVLGFNKGKVDEYEDDNIKPTTATVQVKISTSPKMNFGTTTSAPSKYVLDKGSASDIIARFASAFMSNAEPETVTPEPDGPPVDNSKIPNDPSDAMSSYVSGYVRGFQASKTNLTVNTLDSDNLDYVRGYNQGKLDGLVTRL